MLVIQHQTMTSTCFLRHFDQNVVNWTFRFSWIGRSLSNWAFWFPAWFDDVVMISEAWKSDNVVETRWGKFRVKGKPRHTTDALLSSYPCFIIQRCIPRNNEISCKTRLISVPVHGYLACCFRLKSLCLSDAIWRHRSGSTMAQVMACCTTVN